MSKIFIITLVLILSASLAFGQQMAPRETVEAGVGGGKVTVEYGRPSLNGRDFNELMSKLPPDRMWRAGSEQVTTLSATAPLAIGGTMVPAGKYSVYVHCPTDLKNGSFSLVLNKVLGQPLKDIWAAAPAAVANEPWPHFKYSEEIGAQEVARVPMSRGRGSNSDLFTITLTKAASGAALNMAWGTELWSIDVKPAPAEGSGQAEGSYSN
jgi:hypothetical protein